MKGQEQGCMPVRRICLSGVVVVNVLITQWKLGSGRAFSFSGNTPVSCSLVFFTFSFLHEQQFLCVHCLVYF